MEQAPPGPDLGCRYLYIGLEKIILFYYIFQCRKSQVNVPIAYEKKNTYGASNPEKIHCIIMASKVIVGSVSSI